MPEPSAAELAREAEQEAAVFAQAMNVETWEIVEHTEISWPCEG